MISRFTPTETDLNTTRIPEELRVALEEAIKTSKWVGLEGYTDKKVASSAMQKVRGLLNRQSGGKQLLVTRIFERSPGTWALAFKVEDRSH